MGTTDNLGIPYPESSDLVTNGAAAMQALAEALDGLGEVTCPGANGYVSASTARRFGALVVVEVLIDTPAGGGPAQIAAATLPVGYRPDRKWYFVGVDSASGDNVQLWVNETGGINHVLARPADTATFGTVVFPAAGA